jgi:AcrR family transcriptional regulator
MEQANVQLGSEGSSVASAPFSASSSRVQTFHTAPTSAQIFSIDAAVNTGRRERHRREVLERLLTAAAELIKSRGLQNITVRDITEAADVGKGTFFLYFRTKDHIVPALIARASEPYARALTRARSGESVIHVLQELMPENPAAAMFDNPTCFSSCLMALMTNDEVRASAMRHVTANRERLEALLVIGQERGEIRRDYSAPDLARVTQQVGLGARLLASWGDVEPMAEGTLTSRGLLYSLMQPAKERKPTRRNSGRHGRTARSRPRARRRKARQS